MQKVRKYITRRSASPEILEEKSPLGEKKCYKMETKTCTSKPMGQRESHDKLESIFNSMQMKARYMKICGMLLK